MAGMKFMTLYLMPIMMLCWFNSYASGLTYYYLLSQLFTMLIMYIIRYSVNEEKLLAKLQSNAAKAERNAATKKKSKWQMRYEEALRQQQQMQRQQQQKAYGGSQKAHTAKPQSTKNQPPKKRR
jgi:YidC/Oxa1 family membrane protein insertase